MKRTLLSVVALMLVAPLAVANPLHAQPVTGPDVPTVTEPVAVVTAFENEDYSWTEGVRTRQVTIPWWDWNRVVVELRVLPHPNHPDPWDRLAAVAVEDVELLRSTTPRTDMTLRKDVTEFAAAMPAGAKVNVSLTMGSYEGGTLTTVRLFFYDEPTSAAVRPPADHVVAPFKWAHLCGGGTIARTVAFPDEAPEGAVLELTLSGHGNEELYLAGSRQGPFDAPELRPFHVTVDGERVATTEAWPYAYAILGFYGETGQVLHPLMWWTGQRALDAAGVHPGVGEVPPNRVTLPADVLPLLTGERTVEVTNGQGDCVWITSATFLLDAA